MYKKIKNPLVLLCIISLSINFFFVAISEGQPQSVRTDRIQLWHDNYWYLLGVNYPWHYYGHDFGTTAWEHDGVSSNKSREEVDADFAYLKRHGVHVVRWFLFCDGRASPEFYPNKSGYVSGFDEYFYKDLDTALTIAKKNDIYLILVLLDYKLANKTKVDNGTTLFGLSQMITDPRKRQSFLDRALMPLLNRYGNNSNIIAWDVMNEPELAMDMPGKVAEEPVSVAAMQTFVNDVIERIHTNSSQYATIGCYTRNGLEYFRNSSLDFYQYHYYDDKRIPPLDYPYANLSLDKPCIVGEFPTNNTQRSMKQYLDTIWRIGYAGSLPWSYRADDSVSDFKGKAIDFADWSRNHDADVNITQKCFQ